MSENKLRQIGPFRFQDDELIEGADHWLSAEVEGELVRDGLVFKMDGPYLKAIAEAVRPFDALFSGKENHKKGQPYGRGDIRLVPSTDKKRWGNLAGSIWEDDKEEFYPFARLIMNAGPGSAVEMKDPSEAGRRDYRRANLVLTASGRAQTATRAAFIEAIRRRMVNGYGTPDADEHDQRVQKLFAVADAMTNAPGTTSVIVGGSPS